MPLSPSLSAVEEVIYPASTYYRSGLRVVGDGIPVIDSVYSPISGRSAVTTLPN